MRTLSLLVVLLIAGCAADTSQLDAAIAQVKETRIAVTAEIEKARVEIARSGLTPEQRAAWETKLASATTFLSKVEQVEKRLDAVKDAASTGDPGAAIAAGGAAAAPLGGPYAPLIAGISGIVGAIVTGIWKQRTINAGLEAVGTMSQVINSGHMPMSEAAVRVLNDAQSPAARAFVDLADDKFKVAAAIAPKSGG